ncbi:MAG: efflux RND transporter periplasmic adaptor subunit [candidate division Zixibacteria bacterium]|nr:efflux RND transporter periplasmic adaptor subunit [candidate division Zixibacteria bacterium]
MPKSKKKKIIFVIISIVLFAALVIYAINVNKQKKEKIQAEEVESGDIASIVTATGRLKAKTEVKISADVMGRIVRLPVIEGQVVKAGDLLVEIDPASYLAAVNQSKAALRSGDATLDKAHLAFNRNDELFKRNLISKEELDLSRSDVHSAEGLVAQYKASLDQAVDQLSKTTIRSPMNGVITALNSEQGENVVIGTMNNPGTVIMTISDLSAIEVEAEIDETDIALIELKQNVEISLDAFPDTTFNGVVTEIGNSAYIIGARSQDQVVNFLVTVLLIDEIENVRPGMSATVDITTAEKKDVIKIPIQAVVMRKLPDPDSTKTNDSSESEGNDNLDSDEEKEPIEGVFKVRDEKVEFTPVKTGIADQQDIEIVEGLEKSDTVVTGSFRILRSLEDGDFIEVEKKEKKSD